MLVWYTRSAADAAAWLLGLCAGDVPVEPPVQLQYTPLLDRKLHYYNVGLQGISLGKKSLGVAMVRGCCGRPHKTAPALSAPVGREVHGIDAMAWLVT
jgi:hypothetical protein